MRTDQYDTHRLCEILGTEVVIAERRGYRPSDIDCLMPGDIIPAHDPSCPFCPGNEGINCHVITRVGEIVRSNGKTDLDWVARLVTNQHGVLDKSGKREYGVTDVLIFSRYHNWKLENDPIGFAVGLEMVKTRLGMSRRDKHLRQALFFVNSPDKCSGASLVHPHAQIYTMGRLFPDTERILARNRFQGCRYCRMMEKSERIIAQSNHFVATCPNAGIEGEVWVLPKEHIASIEEIDQAQIRELGQLACETLMRVRLVMGDVPYNVGMLSPPFRVTLKSPRQCGNKWHMMLRITPRRNTGGLELYSGLQISAIDPEKYLAALRAPDLTKVKAALAP